MRTVDFWAEIYNTFWQCITITITRSQNCNNNNNNGGKMPIASQTQRLGEAEKI